MENKEISSIESMFLKEIDKNNILFKFSLEKKDKVILKAMKSLKKRKYTMTLEILDTISNSDQDVKTSSIPHDIYWYLRARSYLGLSNYNKSLENIEKAISVGEKKSSDFVLIYIIIKAYILRLQGKNEEMNQLLNKYDQSYEIAEDYFEKLQLRD